jgi:tRNA A37 methylthiotransferase MiaB
MDGLERIRFTSPHPIGFRQDLVNAYTYLPKLCSHIHFPMQSGSDRILQLMRRPYKNEKYLKLCEAMREARPDLAITTDIIVGFPVETHEDYLETKAAVERIQFDNAFVFQYSPRRDTVAAAMENQICLRVKEERNHDLLECVNETADIILTNIIADVLMFFAEPVRKHINKGGKFICSGISKEKRQGVIDVLNNAGYHILEIRDKGDWTAIVADRD